MVLIDPGNFGGSAADDVLTLLLEQIVSEIRSTFKLDSEKSIYADKGEGSIMGNIDILITLCEHYQVHTTINKPEEVEKWKADYLATFDRNIGEYGIVPQSIVARRKVIVETFDRLYDLVDEMSLE